MSEFVSVAKLGDIPEGEGRSYPVNGTMVAIFFTDGEYKAISDFCPHMGASMAGGYVEANSVTCPWHAWRFCIDDGLWLDNPKSELKVPCYQVRIEGQDIQVCVPAEEPIPESETVENKPASSEQETTNDEATETGTTANDPADPQAD